MDWKKKLMLATGAFVSVPGAVSAHEPPGQLRLSRRTQRTAALPFPYDPQDEQSLRVNVQVPPSARPGGYLPTS